MKSSSLKALELISRSAPFAIRVAALATLSLYLAGCNRADDRNITSAVSPPTAAQIAKAPVPALQPQGSPHPGRDVFRNETFGNESFWHDAMRWQQGIVDSKVTPAGLLKIGLQFDIEAIDPALLKQLMPEFTSDLSSTGAPVLNDPATTIALLNSNAIIGVVAKDTDKSGRIDVLKGDKVGVSCALCHTVTDKSGLNLQGGGTIGKRIDGLAPLTFDMGRFLAMAQNSRAYYLNMQQNHLAVLSIGRAPRGVGNNSSEKEVDDYLSNPKFYPVGTFDETHDGIGNSVKNVPLFRQDLAAPYGTAGEFAKFEDITIGSYTMNLDMTGMATPEGKEFLRLRGGVVGLEMFKEYMEILMKTGVTGYPYVKAKLVGPAGDPHTPIGRLVDIQKVRDLTAYTFALPAPKGAKVNATVAARGRALFSQQCVSCHNVDQSKPVPLRLVDLKTLWPGYAPVPVGLRGDSKQSTVLNSLGTFDDKMVIADASHRGEPRLPRGNALPLLLDLDRTTLFLHDASVRSLEELFNPKRGKLSPHPFYLSDAAERKALIDFLRSLDTEPQNIVSSK